MSAHPRARNQREPFVLLRQQAVILSGQDAAPCSLVLPGKHGFRSQSHNWDAQCKDVPAQTAEQESPAWPEAMPNLTCSSLLQWQPRSLACNSRCSNWRKHRVTSEVFTNKSKRSAAMATVGGVATSCSACVWFVPEQILNHCICQDAPTSSYAANLAHTARQRCNDHQRIPSRAPQD